MYIRRRKTIMNRESMMTNTPNTDEVIKSTMPDAALVIRFICKDGANSFSFTSEQVQSVKNVDYLNYQFDSQLNEYSEYFSKKDYSLLSADEASRIEKLVICALYFKFHAYIDNFEGFSDIAPTIMAAYLRKCPDHLNEMLESGKVEINADQMLDLYDVDHKEANKPLRYHKLSVNGYRVITDVSDLPDDITEDMEDVLLLAKADFMKNGAAADEPILIVIDRTKQEMEFHCKASFDAKNEDGDFDLIISEYLKENVNK